MRFLKKSSSYVMLSPVPSTSKPVSPSECTIIYTTDAYKVEMYRTVNTGASGSSPDGWYEIFEEIE